MDKKQFYVYALCYPDGTPFYIGKGSKNRIGNHVKSAKTDSDHEKDKIILSIINDGQRIVEKILFATDIEKEAYIKEKEYISLYDSQNKLSNKNKGGNGSFTTYKGAFKGKDNRKNNKGGADKGQGAKLKNPETGKRVKCPITLDKKYYELTINNPIGSRSDIINFALDQYFEEIKKQLLINLPLKDTEG